MPIALKRIRIQGFKTFANRTEIDLDGDLTAVVGPNGCGKSNLVDAIVWALGEISPRALRAGSATEVVFAGSNDAKPTGLAEVSLLFDNESRWLPLNAEEVQVTRRLYRNGEWDCWINKTPCRLKDVADLFAGTGLGRGGYAIIGQGDVESFLAATPEERRQWIEEAAGVAGYRHRRRETLRDLETARMHLQRAEDVIAELDRQREPMRLEAERAVRYRELRDELTLLDRRFLSNEMRLSEAVLSDADSRREALDSQMTNLETLIEQQEQLAEQGGLAVAEIDAELDAIRVVQSGMHSALERLEGQWNLAQQRRETISELIEVTRSEIAGVAERCERLASELEESARRLTELASAPDRERQVAELEQTRAKLEDERSHLERLWKQVTEERLSFEQSRATVERLRSEEADLLNALDEAAGNAEAAQMSRSSIEERAEGLKAQLEGLRSKTVEASRSVKNLTDQAGLLKSEFDRESGRLEVIEGALKSGEGSEAGVQAILSAIANGNLPPVYRRAAETISTDDRHRLALSAALGALTDAFVCDSVDQALAAIQYLKDNDLGSATFLPLKLMSERKRCPNCLSQHLEGELKSFFDSVTLAENLEEAIRTVKRDQDIERVVTIDGESVSPAGALLGGSIEKRGAIWMRAEYDSARDRLTQIQTQIDAIEQARSIAMSEEAALLEQASSLTTQLNDHSTRLAGARAEEQAAHKSLADAQKRLDEVRQALRIADDAASMATEYDPDQIALNMDDLRAQIEQITSELAVSRSRDAERRREREALTGETKELERHRANEEIRRTELEGRIAQVGSELKEIEKREATILIERAQADLQLQAAEKQAADLKTKRQEQLELGYQLADKIRQMRSDLSSLSRKDRELELQSARAEARIAELKERWEQEFGDDPIGEPDKSWESEATGVEDRIRSLRRSMMAMGDVNLGAVEEFERLSERHDQLMTQREDLALSHDRIKQSLQEMDGSAREQFEQALDRIRAAFQDRFARLFGGGQCDLIVTDPDDPLSAGVVIEAQPPNKRRQRLELLSGGERALTAASLLFAFLDVNPSPFCVLDEVDAALDGRNVERFVDHVEELAKTSQTLVVTHNPVTIGRAKTWVGVTMVSGVSRIVPYKAGDPVDETRAVVEIAIEPAGEPIA